MPLLLENVKENAHLSVDEEDPRPQEGGDKSPSDETDRTIHSSPDAMRNAAPWTHQVETLLNEWCKIWRVRANLHLHQSEAYANWQSCLAIPCVALPLLFAPVSSGFSSYSCNAAELKTKDLTLAVGFIACSVSSALNAFFKWGEESVKHREAGKHYLQLISDVEELLAMHRKHRPELSVTLRTLKMTSEGILKTAPLIPTRLKKMHHLISDDAV